MTLIDVQKWDFDPPPIILAPNPMSFTARDRNRCMCGHMKDRHKPNGCISCFFKYLRDPDHPVCEKFISRISMCRWCGAERYPEELNPWDEDLEIGADCLFELASLRCKKLRGWTQSP